MPRAKAAPDETMADKSLVEAAESIFADDISVTHPPEPTPEDWSAVPGDAALAVSPESRPDFGKPGIEDMITVRGGGLYLPVRRRVGWMRGYPQQRPEWTIDTIPEIVIPGNFKGGKVEGGYARYRANVFNEHGRLIATGTKTEYSERFTDFVEKCETGAIGRALAVAGYGTEAAVDLDEGLDQERIADAPVATHGRSINITASAIPGVRPGGRPAKIEGTQISEIARLNKSLGLGFFGLTTMMEAVKGEATPPLEEGKEQEVILAFLRTFTHEEAGRLIQMLNQAVAERAKDEK